MSDLKWQEPPPPHSNDARHARSRWKLIADALRMNPEKWAVVAEATSGASVATRLRQGQAAGFAPAGSFEVRAYKVGVNDRTPLYDIYARYVGGGES